MTAHEAAHETAAAALMASRAGKPASAWTPVAAPEPGTWYDWADPATGKVGQCRLAASGLWHQAPRGEAPVVLRYTPPRRWGAA